MVWMSIKAYVFWRRIEWTLICLFFCHSCFNGLLGMADQKKICYTDWSVASISDHFFDFLLFGENIFWKAISTISMVRMGIKPYINRKSIEWTLIFLVHNFSTFKGEERNGPDIMEEGKNLVWTTLRWSNLFPPDSTELHEILERNRQKIYPWDYESRFFLFHLVWVVFTKIWRNYGQKFWNLTIYQAMARFHGLPYKIESHHKKAAFLGVRIPLESWKNIKNS